MKVSAAWRQYCHQFAYAVELPHACQHLIVTVDHYIPHEWADAPQDPANEPAADEPEATPWALLPDFYKIALQSVQQQNNDDGD